MRKTLISVVGPTAIGKTSLAIGLAQHYKTDVISADSRQFFKEMNIGTAVPSQSELNNATHHFIQHKSIHETYSVGDFEKEALKVLETLFQEKDTVILVGGSGLYVDAITKGLDKFPEIDPSVRLQLNAQLETEGISSLQKQMKQLDPRYYEKVDIENPHRLIRALEVCIGSGMPYSSFLNKEKSPRFFDITTVGLTAERALIYDRINKRVDIMFDQGLVEEAQTLIAYKHLNALQTVGYKELFEYFDKKCTLDEAKEEIKKNTRRFAKRQLTWFRKNKETLWVDYEESLDKIMNTIKT